MSGLDAAQTVFTIVKGLAENAQSFFDARDSADRHADRYRLEKASMTFWEYLEEEHSRASDRDERIKSAFSDMFARAGGNFREYERLVKKWHRLVGSNFGSGTNRRLSLREDQPSLFEGSEHGGSRRKASQIQLGRVLESSLTVSTAFRPNQSDEVHHVWRQENHTCRKEIQGKREITFRDANG